MTLAQLYCTVLGNNTHDSCESGTGGGGGTLGIFGWGHAAGNLEPFAYTTAGSAALLLLYTRLTPPPHPPYPRVAFRMSCINLNLLI